MKQFSNFLPFFLIISLLFGCSQPSVKFDNLEDRLENYFDNGHLILVKGEPFSGVAFDEYENGNIFIEASIKNGIPHGKYERYSEYGQLLEKVNYNDGERDGPYESYHDNGQLSAKGNFKDGEVDGAYESYHDNGQLMSIDVKNKLQRW